MGESDFSENAVDRVLEHTDGPQTAPDQEQAIRLEYSRQIVNVNYTKLNEWCDMETDGYIYLEDYPELAEDSIRINIFADIHNYLTSIYSLVEELHQTIDCCVSDNVDKNTFVRGSSRRGGSQPQFIRLLPFAWGLRNQFTHGNYRCLTIVSGESVSSDYLKVEFHKTKFDPRGVGDLQEVGDYLWGVDEKLEQNPMFFFNELNSSFISFWNDTHSWFERATN